VARNTTFGQLIEMTMIEAGMDPTPALSMNVRPLVKAAIKREYERLYDEFDWPFLRVTEDVLTQAGQRYYDVPDTINFDRIEKVDYLWGDRWVPLDRGIDVSNLNTYNSDEDERSDPMLRWDIKWTGDTTQIEVWPIPASNEIPIRFTGIRNMTRLVGDGDRCDLDDQMVSMFASAELLARKNSPEAQLKQQKAVERYRLIRGRSIQTRANNFNFSNAPKPATRSERDVWVAYVRNQ